MRKLFVFTVVVLGLAFLPAPAMVAWAQEQGLEPPSRTQSPKPSSQQPRGETDVKRKTPSAAPAPAEAKGVQLTFPVFGDHHYSDDFGAPRSGGRRHQGTDIFAEKGTPVMAIWMGEVAWVNDGRNGKCCSIAIRHPGGWTSVYIHLNNDTPGTDDGTANGVGPFLDVGSAVQAGQVIGWIGDSGNAEDTSPHLHFELRKPGAEAINPYPFLKAGILGPISAQGGLPHTGISIAIPWTTAGLLLMAGILSLLVAPNVSVGMGRHRKTVWRRGRNRSGFPLCGLHLR